jgi:chromosome segregation ATPase
MLAGAAAVAVMWSCGGAATRPATIPDELLGDVPMEQKESMLAAKAEVSKATEIRQGVLHELDVMNRDIMVSGAERQQARSERHKLEADYRLATAGGDLNQVARSMADLETARAGEKAADVRPNYLVQKRKVVNASLAAASADVVLAEARVELEKAKLAEKHGKRPSAGFSVGQYEKAVATAQKEAATARSAVGREEQATEGFERGYMKYKNEFDRLSGGDAKPAAVPDAAEKN